MKKYINRKSILITSVALLLLVAVGTTIAYVFTKTDPVENKFDPSKVSCAVVGALTCSLLNVGLPMSGVPVNQVNLIKAIIFISVVLITCRKPNGMLPR